MWGARGDRLFRLPAGPALKLGVGSCLTHQSNGNLCKNDSVLMPKGELKLAPKQNPAQGRAAAVRVRVW